MDNINHRTFPNKVSSISARLHWLLSERGLRQIDLYAKAQPFCEKFNTSLITTDISQYVLGKAEPKEKKLNVLARTLDVSPLWLLGYDVPMERNEAEETNIPELLAFEKRVNKLILEDGGEDIAILFHRASAADKETVLRTLYPYGDPNKYPNSKRHGFLRGLFSRGAASHSHRAKGDADSADTRKSTTAVRGLIEDVADVKEKINTQATGHSYIEYKCGNRFAIIAYPPDVSNNNVFTAAAGMICFSDCNNICVDRVVCRGEEYRYAGWQPGQRYCFVDRNGNIVWDHCFPEWEH